MGQPLLPSSWPSHLLIANRVLQPACRRQHLHGHTTSLLSIPLEVRLCEGEMYITLTFRIVAHACLLSGLQTIPYLRALKRTLASDARFVIPGFRLLRLMHQSLLSPCASAFSTAAPRNRVPAINYSSLTCSPGVQSSTLTPMTIRTAYSCFMQPSTGGIAPPGATGNAVFGALSGEHAPPTTAGV
jgi:hypothetical protein